jgi:uncharacterized membrane protein
MLAAREYVGSPAVGYKVALCQRDVAIYGSILVFGLLYAATGRRMKPLPWYLWLLFGILPVALDGISQLISQPPLSIMSIRESTPALRLLTGALFGFTTAWFGIPLIEQTMQDTLAMMADKKRRIELNAQSASKLEAAD